MIEIRVPLLYPNRGRITPVLPKSRHTLKMMVSGIFLEVEITVNEIYDIILNTVTMRT